MVKRAGNRRNLQPNSRSSHGIQLRDYVYRLMYIHIQEQKLHSLLFLTPVFVSARLSSLSAGLSAFPAVVYGTLAYSLQVILNEKGLTPASTGMISPVIQPASLLQRNKIAKFGQSSQGKTDGRRAKEGQHTIPNVPPSSFFLHQVLANSRLP